MRSSRSGPSGFVGSAVVPKTTFPSVRAGSPAGVLRRDEGMRVRRGSTIADVYAWHRVSWGDLSSLRPGLVPGVASKGLLALADAAAVRIGFVP